jgi:hypothetical protein
MMNARFAIVALHASADGLHMSCAILRRRAKNQGYATYNRFSTELVYSNRFYTMLIDSKCLTPSQTILPLRSAMLGFARNSASPYLRRPLKAMSYKARGAQRYAAGT